MSFKDLTFSRISELRHKLDDFLTDLDELCKVKQADSNPFSTSHGSASAVQDSSVRPDVYFRYQVMKDYICIHSLVSSGSNPSDAHYSVEVFGFDLDSIFCTSMTNQYKCDFDLIFNQCVFQHLTFFDAKDLFFKCVNKVIDNLELSQGALIF